MYSVNLEPVPSFTWQLRGESWLGTLRLSMKTLRYLPPHMGSPARARYLVHLGNEAVRALTCPVRKGYVQHPGP